MTLMLIADNDGALAGGDGGDGGDDDGGDGDDGDCENFQQVTIDIVKMMITIEITMYHGFSCIQILFLSLNVTYNLRGSPIDSFRNIRMHGLLSDLL